MAFIRLEKDTANISKLSDRPNQNDGLSSAQLKSRFDLASNDIKTYINETLIPALESLNLSEVPHSKDILGLRVNTDSMIEVTLDGENWQTTGSRGHTILDKNNNILPQRATLKFTNSTVTDDGEVTIIEGVKGDKGESLQFIWDGTQLGVKVEGDVSYQFIDLKGEKGEPGTPGTSLNLKVSRQYDTYEDLPTNPDIGYMCLVGSDLYIFTEDGWVNAGKLTDIDLDIYTNIDGGLFTDEYGVIVGESALEALQNHIIDEVTHENLIIDGTEV